MVYILLAPGFEEMEALAPADLLRRAGVEVTLVGLDSLTVEGGHAISVQADTTLDAVRLTAEDTIVLPGGMGGVRSMEASPAALDFIRTAHSLSCRLTAICAAPTILGRLGLLEGRRAVCYPGMEDQLTGAIPCPGEAVVVDGSIVTSKAAGTAYEFALALISLLTNEKKSEEVRHGIQYFT